MRKLFCVMMFAMVIIPSGALRAQQHFDPQEARKADKLLPVLQSDLRNYLTAQEAFFADSTRYTTSIRTLSRAPYPYRASPDVTIVILTATGTGHSAIAVHADLPDYPCAIRVGSATAPLNDEAREGEATCRWPG